MYTFRSFLRTYPLVFILAWHSVFKSTIACSTTDEHLHCVKEKTTQCKDSEGEGDIDNKYTQEPYYKTRMSRVIQKVVESREQSEGMGARVRRSIGNSQLRNLDPFLMLDEFRVKKPAGFPDHPHRGFETVS